ncbi:DUF5677 domain-containing protein [Glutamicibacter protophormiae]|uniref:DUF5677 domain-containing protein n=1 Tax=Glutamicibacter protophormiae TaxID=37930 RepID=UPI003A8FE55C
MSDTPEAELTDWIHSCISSIRDATGFTVATRHADEFRLLYGLVARTMRYSDAYLTLVDCNMEGEAVPLARAALEHAITLQWVFVVDGGVEKYRNSVAHDRLEHFGKLAESPDNIELRDALTKLGPLPEGSRLGKFMDMVRELDEGAFLETSYRILSQHVHVTHSAVTSFLQPGEDEMHTLYDQEYTFRYQATYVCAIACMLARWVLARLTNDAALLEELERISDKLLLQMQLADQVKPPRKRRFDI